MSRDVVEIVRAGYDAMGERYTAARSHELPTHLLDVISQLPDHSRALDVGCGRGSPITGFLGQKFEVIGVDLSLENVRAARLAHPGINFINANIVDVQFDNESFDLIVAFYVITHLAADAQRTFLRKAKRWLSPDGVLACTLEEEFKPSYVKKSFFGQRMFWHSLGYSEYLRLFQYVGLRIVEHGEVGSGYHAQQGLPQKSIPFVLARRDGR